LVSILTSNTYQLNNHHCVDSNINTSSY